MHSALLLLLLELMPNSEAEIPWGLPVVPSGSASNRPVSDAPASLAKVLMAELASLKIEKKPWPRGTHSLRYHYLTLSEPGHGLPDFLAVGYVDDQPFIRYDSHVGRAEPQAPWMALMDTQYWETETQKHRSWVEVQQVETWTLMSYYNLSSGTHSTQSMFGCDIREDSRSSSFWHFGFDGQDHLSLDLETLSWVSAVPMAAQTKHWWESEPCYAEYDKAYLESLCLTSLRRYLELGGQHLTRREPPKVQVTRQSTLDGGAMLRCWARGFYPPDISLSWWLGEEELALETEHVETLPSGDGTYQMWAAVQVPAGEEAWYTCHVQHCGLNHSLTVAWDPPSQHELIAWVLSLFLLLLVVGGGVVIFTTRFPGGPKIRQESYEQAPGIMGLLGVESKPQVERPYIPKAQQEPGLLSASADRSSLSQTKVVSCGVLGPASPLHWLAGRWDVTMMGPSCTKTEPSSSPPPSSQVV